MLNINKNCTVSIARIYVLLEYSYYVNDNVLEKKRTYKALGVTFDSSLSFLTHLHSVCNSAWRSLEFIIRVSSNFVDITINIIDYIKESILCVYPQ